jgi:hypothetical protein
MPEQLRHLEYGEPVPFRRRKLTRRIAITLVMLFGVAASIPLLMSEYRRMRIIRLYNACAQPTMDRPTFDGTRMPGGGYQYKMALVRPWDELNRELQSNINTRGTMFVGSLRTPTTKREFVVGVDFVIGANPNDIATQVRALKRGSRMEPVKVDMYSYPILPVADSVTTLKIHLGVADPSDPSHFSIPCDVNGTRLFIDGWLKDDGSVTLEWRSEGSATAPALPSPAMSRSSGQSPAPAAGRVER